MKREKRIVLVLLVIGLGIRLLSFFTYFQHNPLMLSFDSGHYHQTACSLTTDNTFSDAQGEPYFYRLPGYPFFIACFYKLFGINPLIVFFIQNILSLAVPLIIYTLTLQLFPTLPIAALLALIIALFHPGYIIYANLLMSELLFSIVFLLFIFFLQKAFLCLKNNSKDTTPVTISWTLFYAGLFLGLASLIRPIGHVIFLISIILLVIYNVKKYFLPQEKKYYDYPQKKNILSHLFYFGSGWLLIVTGWLLRNYVLTGGLFFHTLSGAHFVNHGAIKAIMHEYQYSYDQARDFCYQEINTAQELERKKLNIQKLNAYQEAVISERYAKKILLRNWQYTLLLFLENITKTTLGLYSSELLVISSGGQLPPYQPHSSLLSRAARYLFPQQRSYLLSLIIFYEIVLWGLMFSITCYALLTTLKRAFFTGNKKIIRKKISNYDQELTIFFDQGLICLACIILSLGCGFARLRLPSEYFFIMVTSVYLAEQLSKKGGPRGEQY